MENNDWWTSGGWWSRSVPNLLFPFSARFRESDLAGAQNGIGAISGFCFGHTSCGVGGIGHGSYGYMRVQALEFKPGIWARGLTIARLGLGGSQQLCGPRSYEQQSTQNQSDLHAAWHCMSSLGHMVYWGIVALCFIPRSALKKLFLFWLGRMFPKLIANYLVMEALCCFWGEIFQEFCNWTLYEAHSLYSNRKCPQSTRCPEWLRIKNHLYNLFILIFESNKSNCLEDNT